MKSTNLEPGGHGSIHTQKQMHSGIALENESSAHLTSKHPENDL
jgi:hypothetical protein